MDFIVSLRSGAQEPDVSEQLYNSLKSMTESYDLLIANMPANHPLTGFVNGFFIGTSAPAKDALVRFEALKARDVASDCRYSVNFDATSTIGA